MTDVDVGPDVYSFVDREFDRGSGGNTGFEALLSAGPAGLTTGQVEASRGRYHVVSDFLSVALQVFRASLSGDEDPALAAGVVGDIDRADPLEWHRRLPDAVWKPPVFFRTDEPVLGQLSEIQCCGSAWDVAELLWQAADAYPEWHGPPRHFSLSPAAGTAAALCSLLGERPVVHHLLDNASRPHGMRYFIQRTRSSGIAYVGFDAGTRPEDATFVRSHDTFSLAHHNFFHERLQRCQDGALRFDLPPLALFDSKQILSWPFWSRTRHLFSAEHRSLFPHTAMLDPDGIELEGGETESIETFLRRPQSKRRYFVKYAGTDIAVNWGSRAVFAADTLSRPQAESLTERIRGDAAEGRNWVVQRSVRTTLPISYVDRSGETHTAESGVKWSSFYGPGGLVSLLGAHRSSLKVHGSADTVFSLVR